MCHPTLKSLESNGNESKSDALTLDCLKTGQQAIVESIMSNDAETKLLEMGFIEGATIKVVHRHGMRGNGYPIAVRLDNSNRLIALRKHEAKIITVKLL